MSDSATISASAAAAPVATAAPVTATAAVAKAGLSRGQAVYYAWLMTGLGLVIVGIAGRDFRLAQVYEFLRLQCLIAEVVAGLGAAFCFGGAMHYLDVARATDTVWDPMRWYLKVLFVVHRRILLLLQLVVMAGALAAVGSLILGWNIPWSESWYTAK